MTDQIIITTGVNDLDFSNPPSAKRILDNIKSIVDQCIAAGTSVTVGEIPNPDNLSEIEEANAVIRARYHGKP